MCALLCQRGKLWACSAQQRSATTLTGCCFLHWHAGAEHMLAACITGSLRAGWVCCSQASRLQECDGVYQMTCTCGCSANAVRAAGTMLGGLSWAFALRLALSGHLFLGMCLVQTIS